MLGLAGELRAQGTAVNALWPRTVIDTAALRIAMARYDNTERRRVRKPQIMADAAYAILQSQQPRIHRAASASTTRFCALPE